jgi:hypothetical protein
MAESGNPSQFAQSATLSDNLYLEKKLRNKDSSTDENNNIVKNPKNLDDIIGEVDRASATQFLGTVVGTTIADTESTTLHTFGMFSEHDSFEVLQKWEGVVTSVGTDSFVARLRDLSFYSEEDEEAEFPIEEISQADIALLAPGAVFYWCVGYWDTVIGQRRRASEIRFRRLPTWSKMQLQKARKEAEELSELLAWK